MRYISLNDSLELLKNNGEVAYKFQNGVHVEGSTTTNSGAGNYIVNAPQTDTSQNLMRIYATDLLGNNFISIEMCGCGGLASLDTGGSNLTSLLSGYRGTFFEAPVIASGAYTSTVANVWYKVLTGTITYNGVSYIAGTPDAGDIFKTDGTHSAVTGGGTCALTIPPVLRSKLHQFRKEAFKIEHLLVGDESDSYFSWTPPGYDTMNSQTSTDANFAGFIRTTA